MFAEKGSIEFDNFLDLLGERVRLKGWDKFKAGLDTKCKYCNYSMWSYVDQEIVVPYQR